MTRVAPNFIYPRTVPVYVTTNPSLPITLEDVYYVRAILSRTKWRAFFRGPSVRIFLEARSRQEFRNGSDHYYLTRNLTVFRRARAHDYFVGIAVGRPVRRQSTPHWYQRTTSCGGENDGCQSCATYTRPRN